MRRVRRRAKYDVSVEPGSLTEMVNTYEAGLIQKALEETLGNCTEAAKLLKIKRTTLVEKRRGLGLPIGKVGSNGKG